MHNSKNYPRVTLAGFVLSFAVLLICVIIAVYWLAEVRVKKSEIQRNNYELFRILPKKSYYSFPLANP